MPIIRNAAFEAFDKVPLDPSWAGTRIKDVRDQSLVPGGRAHITLFEAVGDGRPHPRLQTAMPPAVDPDPGAAQWSGGDGFTSVVDFKSALAAALEAAASAVAGADLKDDDAPKGSLAFYRHSIRTQRIGRLFAGAAAAVASAAASGLLGADEAQGARYALEEAKALAYAGKIEFDDHDTGTYHSYGHDAPFVHYLETLLEGLPDDGSPEMALLSPVQREAIRRQRRQAQNHLDHLMRHKYAYRVVVEDDVEKTVGGLLIDRETREVVSETPASQGTLVPRYELLRIAPELAHAHAGAMVHRDGVGGLRLRDGAAVMVPAEGLRTIPVEGERLTFERAPKSDLLRPKQRLDWDRNGYVQSGPISWVSWAGHCDIKAIMEQLGLVLADNEFVKEYRSDTDDVQVFHRDLVLEMLASVMELGSRYSVSDGSGTISRGVHLFGGARNDSRPDRLQFRGLGEGAHFRWPLVGRKDVFTVTKLSRGEEALDLDTVFMRSIPNAAEVSFAPNPNYLKTVEGDYNLIDVSGTTLEYRVKCDRFDEATGYPKQATEKVTLVLERGVGERVFLGTHVKDAGAREVYRVYLDREAPAIIAELDRFVHRDGKYMAEVVESEGVNLPLHADLGCTLSREMERDDPAVFQTLLDVAVRQGQNICADTDK